VTLWIAQVVLLSDAIAEAPPEVPFTKAGGVDWLKLLRPQQMTAPLTLWIAQL